MTLRELLAEATPGPWEFTKKGHVGLEHWPTVAAPDGRSVVECPSQYVRADMLLAALAPELASLVLDMADALRSIDHSLEPCEGECVTTRFDVFNQINGAALLARLDRIDGRS